MDNVETVFSPFLQFGEYSARQVVSLAVHVLECRANEHAGCVPLSETFFGVLFFGLRVTD